MRRKSVVARLICVVLVACVIVPLGQVLVPGEVIGTFVFNAAEAVVTTTIGFALYALLFG